jgi:hypothetical protein
MVTSFLIYKFYKMRIYRNKINSDELILFQMAKMNEIS